MKLQQNFITLETKISTKMTKLMTDYLSERTIKAERLQKQGILVSKMKQGLHVTVSKIRYQKIG